MKKHLIIFSIVIFSMVAYAATEWNDMIYNGTMTFNGVQTSNATFNITAENEIRFQDATGGEYNGFKSPTTLTGSQTFTLFDGDGTNGQFVKTNGSGVLSWGTPAVAMVVETKTADFTAVVGYHYIIDTALGDVTANLEASSGNSGESISFYIFDATNDFIIDGDSAETINGAATFELRSLEENAIIISDNSNWVINSLYVNEYVEAEVSAANYTVSANTYVDATGGAVALEPGTWEVCYEGNAYYEWLSGTIGVSCNTALRTGSTAIDTTTKVMSHTLQTGDTYHVETIRVCAEVAIASDTTYKMSMQCGVADTAAKGNFISGAWSGSIVGESKISARRIK